ncbi:unnamed protein product [Gadus morhua 'NCC']
MKRHSVGSWPLDLSTSSDRIVVIQNVPGDETTRRNLTHLPVNPHQGGVGPGAVPAPLAKALCPFFYARALRVKCRQLLYRVRDFVGFGNPEPVQKYTAVSSQTPERALTDSAHYSW